MKLIHESTSCLLHLLLLAELWVHSCCRPTHSPPLCGSFRAMIHRVDQLMTSAKKIHDLTEEQLSVIAVGEHRMDGLPHIHHTAAHIGSLQVNESLSQLYSYSQSFSLHMDWLKTAKENLSVSSKTLEGATTDVQRLSNLVKTSLQQIGEELPASPSPPPSFPNVSTAFDTVELSLEMSDRLRSFCDWSKRVLRHVKGKSHCPRH